MPDLLTAIARVVDGLLKAPRPDAPLPTWQPGRVIVVHGDGTYLLEDGRVATPQSDEPFAEGERVWVTDTDRGPIINGRRA